MTHDEAVAQCQRRNTDSDGPFRTWRPRQRRDGDWDVVVRVNPDAVREPVHATIEARQPSDHTTDPRGPYERNVGGPWFG